MKYSIEKRPERIDAGDRQLIRINLTPSLTAETEGQPSNIIVTVEQMDGADGKVRPVMPLSIVSEDTYEVMQLDREFIHLAVATAAAEFAAEDEDLMENTPAW